MKSDRAKRRYREKIYELLLALCIVVLVSFAFPRLSWIGPLGYALIALLHVEWRDNVVTDGADVN